MKGSVPGLPIACPPKPWRRWELHPQNRRIVRISVLSCNLAFFGVLCYNNWISMSSPFRQLTAVRVLFLLFAVMVSLGYTDRIDTVYAQDDGPAVVQDACTCGEPNCRLLPCPSGSIPLFAPLDGGSRSLSPDTGGPFGYFFTYVNRALPWLVAIAVGMAVLQGVVGGMQILFSAGGAGKDAGKDRLLWAMAGFVLLTLTGFILKTINPLFFR